MSTSEKLLRDAADAIAERAKLRDTPQGERSTGRAVDMFNAMVGGDKRLTELEGWQFMCCLKLARATAGSFHLDDYVDLAGYAALAGECGAGIDDKYAVHFSVEKKHGPAAPRAPNERTTSAPEEEVMAIPHCCKHPNPSPGLSHCINCGEVYAAPRT